MQVKRLAHGLGAEITDLDLNDGIAVTTVAENRSAWLKHQILVFPHQNVSAERHIAFSRQLGEIDPVSFGPLFRHPDHPEIMLVSNKSPEGATRAYPQSGAAVALRHLLIVAAGHRVADALPGAAGRRR